MRVIVVAVLACIAGCALDGRAIREWTLSVDGGSKATLVTLPSTLLRDLPLRDTDFALRANVPLQSNERGRELTLVFDCFHGAISLAVDGHNLEDRGDTGVGEHIFVIPASQANGPSLELTVTAHHDAFSALFGFGAAPRLSSGSPSRAPAIFDRYVAVAEILIIVVLGLVFAAQYLFDRRRLADGAFAVQAFAALVVPIWELGLLARLGSFGFPVLVMAMTLVVIALLLFLHHSFEFSAYPRRLMLSYGIANAVALVGVTSFPMEALAWVLLLALSIPLEIYILPRLFRLAKQGNKRFEARLILAAAVVAAFQPVVVAIAHSGWHLETIGILAYGFAQALILSRQQVARSLEVERANAELQRQVAERSKELADALARLANRPRPDIETQHVVDGRYRVLRKLGAGGMGSVHEVERLSDRERLALKRLRGHADADALARFAREAQIAAELRHPNLVPVVDVGIADGELFLVMPLVGGGSLETTRERFGIDLPWARRVLGEVATGLAALHGRGIVHRDLKPGNILVSGGVARIADFGLAYFADSRAFAKTVDLGAPGGLDTTITGDLGHAGLTQAGDVFGTPPYMAPELARGVHAAAPASDVFAFGVIAFELATGRLPHSKPPVLVALAGGPYAPPDTSAIDSSLRATIERCLAADPGARPTAPELAAALRSR